MCGKATDCSCATAFFVILFPTHDFSTSRNDILLQILVQNKVFGESVYIFKYVSDQEVFSASYKNNASK